MGRKQFRHTVTYQFDTFSGGNKPYGVYLGETAFKSYAVTERGILRAADNAAFWDCYQSHGAYFRRVVAIDGAVV